MGIQNIRFAEPKAPRGQQVLFAQYLDEVVAADAPVRGLVRLLEEMDWSAWEQAYAGCGQPPIHPRYLAGAIVYGLMHKVRSTRELEDAACNRLDFLWLLEGFRPDHSTFANFRKRHRKAIKKLQKRIAQALVMRREQALLQLLVDGTRFRADSDRHGARTAQTIERIVAELDRRMAELERNDAADAPAQTEGLAGAALEADPQQALACINKQMAQLEEQRAKYQRALDIVRQRDARAQAHDGKNARPVRVPITDPESHILPNKEGGYAPNYTPVAAIEPQTGAIVYADVLEGSDEASAVMPAVEAAEELTGHKADAAIADGNFAAGAVLKQLDEHGTEAYMPTRAASPDDNPAIRPDPTQPVAETDREQLPKRGKHFARTAFIYDEQSDIYYCPMGHTLVPYKHGDNKDGVPCTYYRANGCRGCPLATECVKGKKSPYRTLTRDAYEPLREATAQRMATPEGHAIYRIRAPGIEGLFGVIKSVLDIRRFLTRGLDNVRTEWAWICTAYNLKKLLALEARTASSGPKTGARPSLFPANRHVARSRAAHGTLFVQKTKHRMLRPIRITGLGQYVQTTTAA